MHSVKSVQRIRLSYKCLMVCLMCLGLFFLGPRSSEAAPFNFQLDATLGSSYAVQMGGPAAPSNPLGNFGASIEITPSFQFLMVSLDLGVLYDFVQQGMTLRPGARLHLGWFYLRAAVPLAFSLTKGPQGELFDLGILVGAGLRIGFGQWSFVAEANVSPMFLHIEKHGVSMPAELRLGVAYQF